VAEHTTISLDRRLTAEYLGSLLLALIVVGSGIAAQQLSPTDIGLELLENALVTGVGLYFLITLFGPISGAHFNPVVTLVDTLFNGRKLTDLLFYALVQVAGCISGTLLANFLFSGPLISWSHHHRVSGPHFVAEVVATLGLLLVIFGLSRNGSTKVIPVSVAAYITGAYFFTSSTSFANPAITIGRMFTNSFAGIAPSSAPGFILAQLVGVGLAVALIQYLFVTTSNQ